jgi:5-methylcytosine-specific restriction endonuclease McrA
VCAGIPNGVPVFFGKHLDIYVKMSTMSLEEQIIELCKKEKSMAKASRDLGIPFMTFKRKAVALGVYDPNPSGKGTKKSKNSTDDFLSNKVKIRSQKLKEILFSEELKIPVCEECGIKEWNGRRIIFELDHIDGNNKNNSFDNLKILCPNCHSQTPTFRGRKYEL